MDGGYCFHPFLFVCVCLLLTKSKDFVSILMTSVLCLFVYLRKQMFSQVCWPVCLSKRLSVCLFVCDPSRAHGFDRNDLNIFQVIA